MSITGKIRTASRVLKFISEYKRAGAGSKIDPDAVFFVTDVSDSLTGNLKCVYEQTPARYTRHVYAKNKHTHPQSDEDIRRIAQGLARCGHVFLEDVLDFMEFMEVPEGQQIIQLWHGCGAYKQFGFARPDGQTGGVRVSKGHRRYTGAIVSAEEIRDCYAQGYDIPLERVHATGIPRTDVFFDEAYCARAKERILEKYPQITDRKKILFAPTYRGTRIADATYDFDKLDPEQFTRALGEEYTLLLKWHPAMAGNLKKGAPYPYQKSLDGLCIIDVSEEDINDLMMVSDMMITDYSSAIFEYLLTEKPIAYYVYDRESYASARGLFYSFEDYVYGETASDQEELIRAVKKENLMAERREVFRRRFMSACDGHATERVCELFLNDR